MKEDTIHWLENWVATQINGDWEHEHGIRIQMLDNPGWDISIDLVSYEPVLVDVSYIFLEKDEEWIGGKINNSYLNLSGDIRKLYTLLNLFKEIVNLLDNLKQQNNRFTQKHLENLLQTFLYHLYKE